MSYHTMLNIAIGVIAVLLLLAGILVADALSWLATEAEGCVE